MKKIRFIVTIAVLLTALEQKSYAQFYFYDNDHFDTPLTFELGGSVGIMNCLTDVGGREGLGKAFVKDLNIGNNQLNGGIFLNALYKYAIGLRLEGTFGNIKSYDSILKNVKATSQGRYERNLQFRSRITEISMVAEFHILYILKNYLYEDDLNIDDEPPRLSPYLAAGIGYFSFNPQAMLNGNWIDLQPLSTEGQGFEEYPGRKSYKLSQTNLQLGAGIKYELSPKFNVRAEFITRILATDYLDDLSTRYIDPKLFSKYFTGEQLNNALALNDRRSKTDPDYPISPNGGQRRGNPKDNDSFFTFNLKMGMTFGRESRQHGGSTKQVRCPNRF